MKYKAKCEWFWTKINKSPGQRSDSDSWLMLHDVTWPRLIISKECCVPRVSAPLSLPSVSPQLVGCWGAPLFEPGGEPLSREGSITGGGERGEGEPRPDNQWRIFRREGVRYKIWDDRHNNTTSRLGRSFLNLCCEIVTNHFPFMNSLTDIIHYWTQLQWQRLQDNRLIAVVFSYVETKSFPNEEVLLEGICWSIWVRIFIKELGWKDYRHYLLNWPGAILSSSGPSPSPSPTDPQIE